MTVEREYLTLAEAAAELEPLQVSRRTLARYAAEGRLGALRVGRDYRIPKDVVDDIKRNGLPGVVS